jgi:hypothetical protein
MRRLRLLGSVYRTVGGFLLLASVLFGIGINRAIWCDPAPVDMKATMASIWYIQVVGGILLSIAMIACGRWLRTATHYRFCMTVATLICFAFPLGTALGVYTRVVLREQETHSLFREAQS